MIAQLGTPITPGTCPVCGARDAFIDRFQDGGDYYVECVNCRIYRASRRTFRHFEYLRGKADAEAMARLQRLAATLHARERGAAIYLDYDTWDQLTP